MGVGGWGKENDRDEAYGDEARKDEWVRIVIMRVSK